MTTVKESLAPVLAQLVDRERKLTAATTDLADTRAAIRALVKLGVQLPDGQELPQLPALTPERKDGSPSTIEIRDIVLATLRGRRGVPYGEFVAAAGVPCDRVKRVVHGLRESNQVQATGKGAGTRYWLTEELDAYTAEHGDHDEADAA